MYHQTINFWFTLLRCIGMSPDRPKNYFTFIFIVTLGNIIFGLVLADFFYNPDASYMDAIESIVLFSHVRPPEIILLKLV